MGCAKSKAVVVDPPTEPPKPNPILPVAIHEEPVKQLIKQQNTPQNHENPQEIVKLPVEQLLKQASSRVEPLVSPTNPLPVVAEVNQPEEKRGEERAEERSGEPSAEDAPMPIQPAEPEQQPPANGPSDTEVLPKANVQPEVQAETVIEHVVAPEGDLCSQPFEVQPEAAEQANHLAPVEVSQQEAAIAELFEQTPPPQAAPVEQPETDVPIPAGEGQDASEPTVVAPEQQTVHTQPVEHLTGVAAIIRQRELAAKKAADEAKAAAAAAAQHKRGASTGDKQNDVALWAATFRSTRSEPQLLRALAASGRSRGGDVDKSRVEINYDKDAVPTVPDAIAMFSEGKAGHERKTSKGVDPALAAQLAGEQEGAAPKKNAFASSSYGEIAPGEHAPTLPRIAEETVTVTKTSPRTKAEPAAASPTKPPGKPAVGSPSRPGVHSKEVRAIAKSTASVDDKLVEEEAKRLAAEEAARRERSKNKGTTALRRAETAPADKMATASKELAAAQTAEVPPAVLAAYAKLPPKPAIVKQRSGKALTVDAMPESSA